MNFFKRLFNKIFNRSKAVPVVIVPPLGPVVITPVASTPVASGVVTPKVILGDVNCQYQYQEQIVQDGFALLNKVFADPEFKIQFMAFKFEQTNGMSNQQIWDLMCSGPFTLSADLRDMGYISDHVYHTIGLDDSSEPGTIFMNSYFVGTAFMVCTNAGHELMHFLKFSHRNSTDYQSVPYGMNFIVELVLKKMNIS